MSDFIHDLCPICGQNPSEHGLGVCKQCQTQPDIEVIDEPITGKSPVVLRDDQGNVIYETVIDTTGDVNAQVKDMFDTLKAKGFPLIKLTIEESEN